jgi:serine/threonine protein kinase
MSPEQADSRRGSIDHRSDVYSLGVTLYETLTLTQPFQGNGAHEVIRRILTEEPRRPGRVESRVPADLETICLHAIEKTPRAATRARASSRTTCAPTSTASRSPRSRSAR